MTEVNEGWSNGETQRVSLDTEENKDYNTYYGVKRRFEYASKGNLARNW